MRKFVHVGVCMSLQEGGQEWTDMVADEGWPLPGPGDLPAAPGARGEELCCVSIVPVGA